MAIKPLNMGALDRWGVFASCALILVLPISIALIESFAALVIFIFLLKKLTLAHEAIISPSLKDANFAIRQEAFSRIFWRSLIPRKHVLYLPLVIYIIVIFLSLLFSQDRILSIWAFFGKVLEAVFLTVGIHDALKKKSHINAFLFAFGASAVAVALSGLSQYFFGKDFLRGTEFSGERVSSCLRHANDFGAYLIVVFPIFFTTMVGCWYSKVRQKKWLITGLLVLLGVVLWCLLLTYSRSAWLAFCLELLMLFLMFPKLRLPSFVVFVIFFFVFLPALKSVRHVTLVTDKVAQTMVVEPEQVPVKVVTSAPSPSVEAPLLKIPPVEAPKPLPPEKVVPKTRSFTDIILDTIGNTGGDGRSEYWRKAMKIIQTAPVLGTGLNTYSKVALQYPTVWGGGYSHNCYLQMTAETGILGLFAFLYLIIVVLCYCFKRLSQMKDLLLKQVLIGTLAALIGYFIQIFFDTTFYSVQLGNLLWVVMGFVLAVADVDSKLTKTRSPV